MTRQPDPDRKPALLQEIVDYLVDKPLSALTFRSLATTLGVSSFTLVYHFGTRAELVREIIEAIANRQRGFEVLIEPADLTLDSYVDGLRRTFELTLLPHNRSPAAARIRGPDARGPRTGARGHPPRPQTAPGTRSGHPDGARTRRRERDDREPPAHRHPSTASRSGSSSTATTRGPPPPSTAPCSSTASASSN
ncbi:MAG: TetR/AcrR family transcriptional regulator [Galbitalea sp.]